MLDSVFGVSISKKWPFLEANLLNCSFKSWVAKWFGELYLFEFMVKVYLSGRINPEIFKRWSSESPDEIEFLLFMKAEKLFFFIYYY